jgi:nucleoside-diphosphate-sugar epimerase
MVKQKKFTVGLTGCSGFIGSHVRRHLIENGAAAVCLDGLVHPDSERSIQGLKPVPDKKLDWVLHFGASKSIEASFRDPVEIYRRNMHSTLAALKIAITCKARFLYMSSYVYGQPRYLPVDEKHPVEALNPYMGSKLLGEQLCRQIHESPGLSVIILRGFTFYGPGQDGDQLIPSVTGSIRAGRPIVVMDPDPVRDYLYISDLSRLVAKIVYSGYSGFEIYNVGGGRPYRNIEVAEIANKLAEDRVKIRVMKVSRRNDVKKCYANIDKAARDFHWRPEVDLPSGLRKCIFAKL